MTQREREIGVKSLVESLKIAKRIWKLINKYYIDGKITDRDYFYLRNAFKDYVNYVIEELYNTLKIGVDKESDMHIKHIIHDIIFNYFFKEVINFDDLYLSIVNHKVLLESNDKG